MNYKKIVFVLVMCLLLFGCGKNKNDGYKFNFSTGFPTSELVDNVPKPEFGDSSYYDYYDGSIYITVKNITEDEAKTYISSLIEHGWNVDLGEDNNELRFSAYDASGKYILATYEDEKLQIEVDSN